MSEPKYYSSSKEVVLTGLKELDEKLVGLTRKVGNTAARTGLSRGVRLIAKVAKKKVPVEYKHVRSLIGSRVKRGKDKTTFAKAGWNVGKKKKPPKKGERGDRPGVGISSQNIHWLVVGTKERARKRLGSTGSMEPELDTVMADALSSTKEQVKQAIEEGVMSVIERESKKKG